MFYDLNIPWSPTDNDRTLGRRLAFAHELGYNVVALNHTISGKLPADLTSPITLPASAPPSLNLLRRCTLLLSASTSHQNARLASLAREYDILALAPTDEKTLTLACSSLDCDIITLDLTERLGYWLNTKGKLLAGAIKEGKKIEICYSGAVMGEASERRNLISNVTQLIRTLHGRGLIFSSGSSGLPYSHPTTPTSSTDHGKAALGLRAPYDIINLAAIWGLAQEKAHEAVSENCRHLVAAAGMKRRGWRGGVGVVYGGEPAPKVGGEGVKEGLKGHGGGKKRKIGENGDGGETGVENGEGGEREEKISKREMKRRRKAGALAEAAKPADNTDRQEAAANG